MTPLEVVGRAAASVLEADLLQAFGGDALQLLPSGAERPPCVTALREGIDTDDPAMLLRYYPAPVAVVALHAAYPDLPTADEALLTAVADHLRQWQDSPNGPDKKSSQTASSGARPSSPPARHLRPCHSGGGPFWV